MLQLGIINYKAYKFVRKYSSMILKINCQVI